MPERTPDPQQQRPRVPAWYRLVPFLGEAPPLKERQWRVLGLIGLGPLAMLAALALLAPLIVALLFPETRGRELEEISPER